MLWSKEQCPDVQVLSADELVIPWQKFNIDMHHLWLFMLLLRQGHACHLDSSQLPQVGLVSAEDTRHICDPSNHGSNQLK